MANKSKEIADEKLKQAFKLYGNLLNKYCAVRLREVPSSVDDCVQNTFLIYYKKVRADEEIMNPKAFLYRTADNMIKRVIAEHYKNAKHTVELEKANDIPVEDVFDHSADLDYDYLKEMLLSKLSPEEQILYQQKYVDRLSLKEIGELYQIDPTTVANRTSRLRTKIKSLIDEVIDTNKKGGSAQ